MIALAPLIAAAAAAQPSAPDGQPAQYYGCYFSQQVAGRRLSIRATVSLEGRASGFLAIWWGGEVRPRMERRLTWSGDSYEAMAGNARLSLQFYLRRQLYARAELRPMENGAVSGTAIAAGDPVMSRIQSLESPWRTLDAPARAPGGLAAVVTGHDGRVVVEARIDAAAYDAATAAIRDGRARLEAMVADYRNRCAPERDEELVIT
jgi:hypothetical protein